MGGLSEIGGLRDTLVGVAARDLESDGVLDGRDFGAPASLPAISAKATNSAGHPIVTPSSETRAVN